MPTIKINDVELSVTPGTLVLDACRTVGIDIPHYCYHPALTPVATCRMCLVEIEGQPKPPAPPPRCRPLRQSRSRGDGGLHQHTPAVADARAGVMEFLLINHPLDCPICDQAGVQAPGLLLPLRPSDSRMAEVKRRYRYMRIWAPRSSSTRHCIHCTRCVHFTGDQRRLAS
ncbi:MAG: (2Fe-2S)-binding protein [Holophagaceae bacterium]|nr:(2Fe-2S)-binding protein [Holophagaceae bacterium]